MSFAHVALEDFPVRLWMLDGSSPFVDHTAFGPPATTTSTRKHAALIKGARNATIVGNTNKLSFDAPIMKRGKEGQPFSIEVTVRSIKKSDSVAAQQIFGTASEMDGLVIAGTILSFTTKYANTGEARCEFDLEENRSFTAVAIHTSKRNALYVNGDLVDEVFINEDQQADTYASAGTSLTCGTSTGDNLLAVNGLAIFTHALDDGDINAHYDEALDNMDEFTVASAYGGSVFALNSSTSIPLMEYSYTDDEHWLTGMMTGVTVEYGQLVPESIAGISMSGTWEVIVPLPPATILSSITLDWQGTGATVETSLDGSTWTKEKRSARISTVYDGFNTNEKTLFVRASFDGGIENDQSYFDGLIVTLYGPITTVAPSLETRSLTMTNASIEADYDITEYHENWGIELDDGVFSLSGASATAMSPATIQLWVKKGGSGTFTDNLANAPTNWYTNDGTYQQSYQVDEWQLRTYTFTNGHAGPITITGTGQIGCIVIYPYVMTAAQVKDTYTAYTGTKTLQVTESGPITILDLSDVVDIYEYDWSIESAG